MYMYPSEMEVVRCFREIKDNFVLVKQWFIYLVRKLSKIR